MEVRQKRLLFTSYYSGNLSSFLLKSLQVLSSIKLTCAFCCLNRSLSKTEIIWYHFFPECQHQYIYQFSKNLSTCLIELYMSIRTELVYESSTRAVLIYHPRNVYERGSDVCDPINHVDRFFENMFMCCCRDSRLLLKTMLDNI